MPAHLRDDQSSSLASDLLGRLATSKQISCGLCRRVFRHAILRLGMLLAVVLSWVGWLEAAERPHVILVMADDQGWGETSYNHHPLLKTPNLDHLAASGLRFDRFYAGAPVCSPTRASVLTGRSNNRTGVQSHGYALRRQEKTLSVALREAGYRTGHFGKWHLNGLRGPGVPVLSDDSHHPGVFGFEEWLSVTNFFDRDPILGRRGTFEEYRGDSSEIVVEEALKFITDCVRNQQPSLTVIWFGTPHSPFRADPSDLEPFAELYKDSKHHYGELVAMDRSIGRLQTRLGELNITENTVLWFCSDNGGLPKIQPETVGGLRGFKSSLYEGGLRVPCVVQWPARITAGRITAVPACTMDIFPTLVDALQLPPECMLSPQDGESLLPLFEKDLERRAKPIPFNCFNQSAWIDNDYKLLHVGKRNPQFELYNLRQDPAEKRNLLQSHPQVATRMQAELASWLEGLQASVAGQDYPERTVLPGEPEPQFWMEVDAYRPYFDEWRNRPEYESRLKSARSSR